MAAEGLPVDRVSNVLIPASRIMRERDEHKAAWARELTRAEQLDRELAEALRSVDDWRAIAISNGEELARERVSHARTHAELLDEQDYRKRVLASEHDYRRREQDAASKQIANLTEREQIASRRFAEERKRANALAKWIEDSGVDMSDIEDLIREAGVECKECATHGPDDDCACYGGRTLR